MGIYVMFTIKMATTIISQMILMALLGLITAICLLITFSIKSSRKTLTRDVAIFCFNRAFYDQWRKYIEIVLHVHPNKAILEVVIVVGTLIVDDVEGFELYEREFELL
jgi:hypothetical protein